jgi:hypothetical protein
MSGLNNSDDCRPPEAKFLFLSITSANSATIRICIAVDIRERRVARLGQDLTIGLACRSFRVAFNSSRVDAKRQITSRKPTSQG